jgi:hypothetical protein
VKFKDFYDIRIAGDAPYGKSPRRTVPGFDEQPMIDRAFANMGEVDGHERAPSCAREIGFWRNDGNPDMNFIPETISGKDMTSFLVPLRP